MAIGAFVILNPIFYMDALAPHLPTPLLFASLYVAPSNAYPVWDELAARPLASRWTEVLAERIIHRRGADQHDNSSSRWFEKLNAAGKISSELQERYYSEGWRGGLWTPAHARVGKPFEVRMRVDKAVSGWSTQLSLMFGGYTVGEDPEPVGRMNNSLWSYQLAPEVFARHREVAVRCAYGSRIGSRTSHRSPRCSSGNRMGPSPRSAQRFGSGDSMKNGRCRSIEVAGYGSLPP